METFSHLFWWDSIRILQESHVFSIVLVDTLEKLGVALRSNHMRTHHGPKPCGKPLSGEAY